MKKTYTIQVTRGAAQQESQDTQQKGETQAPADGQQYFTIDGTNLYLTDSIPDRYVLDGMRKDGIDTPLRLLYLVDENGQNGALYMLDLDDPEEIYPFVCMNYNQYKHTIGEETTSAEASTQEGETGLFQSTESQMRLILCAFVVVVLILLIIIVVLIVKRKKDDDDPYDDFYDDDDDDDEDYDDPDDEKLYETDDPDDTGISKRYGKETFRKKGGFMHKLLEGIEDDLDDNLEDDLDDPEEDTDDREKEREKREDHYRDADDEDIMLQKELAEEVRSSMLGRKKKTTQKDTDDDIEFIDL